MRSNRQISQLCAFVACCASALAQSTAVELSAEESAALQKALYERRYDPSFDGKVQFIPEIPLISRVPECRTDSQYLTSLILYGRGIARGLAYAELSDLMQARLTAETAIVELGVREATVVCARVEQQIFGDEEWIASFERENPPPNSRAGGHSHPHGESRDGLLSSTGCRAPSIPLVGRTPTRLEVTTGYHALRYVDEQLQAAANERDGVLAALNSPGIDWEIISHSPLSRTQIKRFLDKGIPFALHQDGEDMLVCGYAEHDAREYLMGYELAGIERKVTLNSGVGGLTYSEYIRLRDEYTAMDSPVALDPLFWDFASYFSVRNLPSFRLVGFPDTAVATVVYPRGLRREVVNTVIRDEIEAAKSRVIAKERERSASKAAKAARPQSEELRK